MDQEAGFGGASIVLEKVLIDSTVTSLIFRTTMDLNIVDSITLKDDMDNYYSKAYTFFNSVPLKYQKANGYVVLNFKPIPKGTMELIVELIDWKKGNQKNEVDKKAVFKLSVKHESIQQSMYC